MSDFVYHRVAVYVPKGSNPNGDCLYGDAAVMCSYESEADAKKPHALPQRPGLDVYGAVVITSSMYGVMNVVLDGSEEKRGIYSIGLNIHRWEPVCRELMHRHLDMLDSIDRVAVDALSEEEMRDMQTGG